MSDYPQHDELHAKNVTVYICSDATLTYGPYGSTDKIIEQALPVCYVENGSEAEKIITLVAQSEYKNEADPTYLRQRKGKPIPEGTGPARRHRYTLNDFRRGDEETIATVGETLTAIRDALRARDNDALRAAFAKAIDGGYGLTVAPVHD
jgi:hypothetical protein